MLDYAYTMRPETEDFSVFDELDSKKRKYRGLAVTKKRRNPRGQESRGQHEIIVFG